MDLAAVIRAMQALLSLHDTTSDQCGGPGINVSTFCTDSTTVFSDIMYISAKGMPNMAAECICHIHATENAPLYIALVGEPQPGCDARLRVIADDKRFTIKCDEDDKKGDIAFINPTQPATIRFTRSSSPTEMCTNYYIADGKASVTMTCYKSGDGKTTTEATTSTTTSTTTPTTTTAPTTTTVPTTTEANTTTPTTYTTTTPNTTSPVSSSTSTTTEKTTTIKTTSESETTRDSIIDTTETDTSEPDPQDEMPIALIMGGVGGFVVVLGIIIAVSILCGSTLKGSITSTIQHNISPWQAQS